jgi:hypothetical protein
MFKFLLAGSDPSVVFEVFLEENRIVSYLVASDKILHRLFSRFVTLASFPYLFVF